MAVIGGLATIPSRENTLRLVIDSILPQVDELYVAFNDYRELPEWLTEYPPKLHFFLTGEGNMGDAEKFRFVDAFPDSYFCSFDDDLIVSSDHVQRLKNGIDRYKGLVSFHGRLYGNDPIFYKPIINYNCLNSRKEDVFCNLIGTGCCAFHTSVLQVSISDFEERNCADIFLSRLAFRQNVPMVVLHHPASQFKYLQQPRNQTIFHTEAKQRFERQTRLLKTYIK